MTSPQDTVDNGGPLVCLQIRVMTSRVLLIHGTVTFHLRVHNFNVPSFLLNTTYFHKTITIICMPLSQCFPTFRPHRDP